MTAAHAVKMAFAPAQRESLPHVSRVAKRTVEEMLELVFDPMPLKEKELRAREVIGKLSEIERSVITRVSIEKEELLVVADSFGLSKGMARKTMRAARVKLAECKGVRELCFVAEQTRLLGY